MNQCVYQNLVYNKADVLNEWQKSDSSVNDANPRPAVRRIQPPNKLNLDSSQSPCTNKNCSDVKALNMKNQNDKIVQKHTIGYM